MQDLNLSKWLQGLIWACLGIILFSPLYISSQLFFPFIVTKTIAFMIATEVMFVAYLALAWKDPAYRLRANMVVALIGIYIVILTIASALGNDFYRGFWSNNERSDGILLLIHLFLFSWVLTSFFRKIKDWLIVFDIFLVASFCVSVVAIDQFFGWDHFLASSNGARLAATIGNAGYVGGYMAFGVFIALFMLFKRKNIPLKFWYGFLVILEMFIAIQTQTRGAIIALAVGGMIFVLYLLFFYYNKKIFKLIAVLIILASIGGVSSIFIFKETNFVRSQQVLYRIASISLKDGTTNNRLVTWGIAWQGFKERPILGYGQENFYEPFDKYYTTKNTEQWFDRSHNMIGDRAITGGIIGLISYLSILLLPFFFLWKFHKNSDKEEKAKENTNVPVEKTDEPSVWARKYFVPIIFSILILAYIIQNMFIFEALVTYVPLMIVLCFVGMYGPHFNWKFLANNKFKAICFWIGIVLLVPMIYLFNVYPVSANVDFIKTLASPNLSVSQRMDSFENVISRGTYGNQEYRRHYFEFFQSTLTNWASNPEARKQISQSDMAKYTSIVEQQLKDQITENNHSVANYLMLMRFYDVAYIFDPARLNKSIEAFNSAKEFSPGRPQIYYELSQTYFYLGNYYLMQKEDKLADDAFRKSLDVFYFGAQLNYYKAPELNELVGYLSWASKSEAYAKVASKNGMGGKKIEEITADMISWLPLVPSDQKDATVSTLKDVVKYFAEADKGNKTLQAQLESL